MADKLNEIGKEATEEINGAENILETSENFIENNGKSLLIGLGVALIVILGIFYYIKGVKGPQNEEAAQAMFPAEQEFRRDSFNVALNGNANVVGFLSIIKEYGSTDAGNMAKAYAGICYKKLGDNEKAIEYLNSYSSSEGVIKPAIEGAIGDCYWDLQKEDEAIKAYKKAISSEDKLVSPIYLRRLGILYLKKEDKANAKIQFQTIKEKYSQSEQAREAEKYLAQCE